jgi:hypothetical protein
MHRQCNVGRTELTGSRPLATFLICARRWRGDTAGVGENRPGDCQSMPLIMNGLAVRPAQVTTFLGTMRVHAQYAW